MSMKGGTFNTTSQAILVKVYGCLSKYIDLESGFFGSVYRWIYFRYKYLSDRETLALVEKIVVKNSVVIDVGANIGFFSIAVCRFSSAQCVAFEPEPKNFNNLQKNIQSAKLTSRISTHPIALSNNTGRGELYISDMAPTDHKIIMSSFEKSINIDVMRMDDFYEANKNLFLKPVSIVKIDVQGAEQMVVEGMTAFLPALDWPTLIVEFTPAYLNKSESNAEEFLTYFTNLQYEFFDIKLRKKYIIKNLLLLTKAYIDIVMVHKSTALYEKLEKGLSMQP